MSHDVASGPAFAGGIVVPSIGGYGVDPNARYRVVLPDFLARGGDGLGPVLATIDPRQVDLGETRGTNLRDDLVDFWVKNQETFSPPSTGRVNILEDSKPCGAADSHGNP